MRSSGPGSAIPTRTGKNALSARSTPVPPPKAYPAMGRTGISSPLATAGRSTNRSAVRIT